PPGDTLEPEPAPRFRLYGTCAPLVHQSDRGGSPGMSRPAPPPVPQLPGHPSPGEPSPGEPTPGPDRPLRADARRNRARVLAGAVPAFAAGGLSGPIGEIARPGRGRPGARDRAV